MHQHTARGTVAIIGTRGYPSYYGGFETAVRYLAPYLADRGWDVSVYGRPNSVALDDPARDPRIESVFTGGLDSKSLSTLSFGFNAVRHAARRRPDVALVMNVANGFFLPLLRARSIPTLVNVDGMEWERAKWGRLAKSIFRAGARATARYADEIACDSTEIARRWKQDFGRDGLFIPYGGVVPEPAPLVEPGLTSRGYVLYVARFVPENSFVEFLAAAETVAASHNVVIVGSSGYGGEFDDAAAALAARAPRVRWLGHVSDDDRLASLWQHAGAYFHGHSVGGTNPALVQAMAAGAPIVARDTVYSNEVLSGAGVLVAPEPEAIAAALLALLTAPEEQNRLSALARARAAEAYTWESVCATYESALRELARSS